MLPHPIIARRGLRATDYAFFSMPVVPFAHRGGAAYGPNRGRENTLHAFAQAVALGYRYLETDVHATTDGVLFAFHDSVLDRVTNSQGAIANMTAEQVRGVRIAGTDPIPTLAELFTAFPRARFNIDAKADASVDLLADTIEEYEAWDRVCVSSFSPARLYRLRKRLGRDVATAATTRGIAWNRFAPWITGLVNTPAPVLQLPITHLVGKRTIRVLTPGLVRAVHRAGKQVHVWTIDDAAQMNWLIDAGVDGIFTDRIDTLKNVLIQRDLWV